MKIPKNWTFKSDEVANNFNEHVNEQLPWYSMLSDIVKHIITAYIPENGKLVDLGCSTGNVTAKLETIINDRNVEAISIDNSPNMISIFNGVGKVKEGDISNFNEEYDVCVLFLSLMFLDETRKAKLLQNLLKNRRRGGAIIIVDKTDFAGGYLGTVISRISMLNKMNAGASSDDILKKELSLSGVQRPSKKSLLTGIGFKQFFQVGEFVGLIYDDDSVL